MGFVIIIIVFFVILIVLNEAYRRTHHFRNQYFRVSHLTRIPRDVKFDVINLGSSQPHFGFDYSKSKIRGYNMAVYPQYFDADYALLRHFSDRLQKNATVIIAISLLNFFGVGKSKWHLYYSFLKKDQIPNFKVSLWFEYRFPLLKHPMFLRYLLRDERRVEYEIVKHPCDSSEKFESDAMGYVSRWNKGFNIQIPGLEITEKNKKDIAENISVLKKTVDFCKTNGFKPIFVVLPTTEHLANKFSEEFVEEYVNKPLKRTASDVPILNYFGKSEYMNSEWYMSSFFLNEKGRIAMTEVVLNDIAHL